MSEWTAEYYADGNNTQGIVLTGGELDSTAQVRSKIEELLHCTLKSDALAIDKYKSLTRSYYFVTDNRNNISDNQNAAYSYFKSRKSGGVLPSDFFVLDKFNDYDDAFLKKVRNSIDNRKARILAMIAGLGSVIGMVSSTIGIYRFIDDQTRMTNEYMAGHIAQVPNTGGPWYQFIMLLVFAGLFCVAYERFKICKFMPKEHIHKFCAFDKVVYRLDCPPNDSSNDNALVLKRLESLNGEHELPAGEKYSVVYHDGSKDFFITRDYAKDEKRPDALPYTAADLIKRNDNLDSKNCVNRINELKGYYARAFPATVQRSLNEASYRTSLVKTEAKADNFIIAGKLCNDIRSLERSLLSSTSVSDKLDAKLAALKDVGSPDITVFIGQLRTVKTKMESLDSLDENIDSSMADIDAVIRFKTQLK